MKSNHSSPSYNYVYAISDDLIVRESKHMALVPGEVTIRKVDCLILAHRFDR